MLACDTVTPRRIVSPTGKDKVLGPVHPNAGIEAAYRKRLEKLIDEMHASVVYWLKATWRAKPPEMIAQDSPDGGLGGSPATRLRMEMERLGRRWTDRFDEAAPELAKYFAAKASARADAALQAILKKAGFTVNFKLTRAQNDILRASIGEQVGLIKSIAQQHLQQVSGAVMRAVQNGTDLHGLTKELEERFGVTRRRAVFIARDQTNKINATVTRARYQELGIQEAVWMHSSAGRHPRASHIAASGKRYPVAEGMLIDGERIYPGQLPNCRCVCRPVLPSFKSE